MPHDSINHLQQQMEEGGTKAFDIVPTILRKVINKRLWADRLDKDGKPFTSFEAFAKHRLWQGLETTIEELRVYCRKNPEVDKTTHGRGRRRRDAGRHSYNITDGSARGTNPTYTLRRLKRDRPDLAQKVIDGDMSANAAAIEAGFRKRRRCPHCGGEL